MAWAAGLADPIQELDRRTLGVTVVMAGDILGRRTRSAGAPATDAYTRLISTRLG